MQGITSQQAARAAAIVWSLLALRLILWSLSISISGPVLGWGLLIIGSINPLGYAFFYWIYSQPQGCRKIPLKTAALVTIVLGVAPGLFVQISLFASYAFLNPFGWVLTVAGFGAALLSILFYLRIAGKVLRFPLETLAMWLLILGAIGAIDNVTALLAWFRQTLDGTYLYEWSRNPWNTLLDWTQTPLLFASIAAQLLFYWTLMRRPGSSAPSIFSAGSGDA